MSGLIPPRWFRDSLKVYWPYITGISVAGWALFTWLGDQRTATENRRVESEKQAQVHLIEAKKPFLTKKLELFFETAHVAGQLVWANPNSDEWRTARVRFLALRWSEMQMVGTAPTRARMRDVQFRIEDFERNSTEDTGYKLRQAIECLADELRHSLEAEWSGVQSFSLGGLKVEMTGNPRKECEARQ